MASHPGYRIPKEKQQKLSDAIAASQDMLSWPDDWDGEGSPHYDEATWLRATTFLRESAESLWDDFGVATEIPCVLPGPNGSIDLHWRTGTHELLVNFPADPAAPVAFYGDDSAGNVIKGEIAGSAQKRWFLLWLAE